MNFVNVKFPGCYFASSFCFTLDCFFLPVTFFFSLDCCCFLSSISVVVNDEHLILLERRRWSTERQKRLWRDRRLCLCFEFFVQIKLPLCLDVVFFCIFVTLVCSYYILSLSNFNYFL